jgi:hypothetical protein
LWVSDHWLPPDNFQESPTPEVAHRTSPTNVGLLLLATTAARDFGYTATLEMIERLELTFATFEKLPRYQGHFFNWYDTRLLEPLTPRYVSTVDSGNLAGHLIAVKQACIDLHQQPLFDARCIDGLTDTALFLRQEADRIRSIPERIPGHRISQLLREVEAVYALPEGYPPLTLGDWAALFDRSSQAADCQRHDQCSRHEKRRKRWANYASGFPRFYIRPNHTVAT